MDARRFAMFLGVVFLLIGVLAFIPGVTRPDPPTAPTLTVHGPGEGYMFGLFRVNVHDCGARHTSNTAIKNITT